ncbi:MAG: Asp-tRNA(Asn)/Glu-tRNA(Gln) amidotransferase subunit GatC [Acidimicrobiales bacterium]|jgi:aspartyl-tRNA(Asn)/glutamyl-tRNA(Gln) amidotransferase subunit C|nr:Asp-tRNA(Asn)/Glu-tRNA(Gln) amidotransferase subunit GatC [Acidimicrobiales bacterium]
MMSEPITPEEVTHVAYLARLRLTEDELSRFTEQLGAVLTHAADVEALELDDVEPMSHPLPVENTMREDAPQPMLKPSDFLNEAPAVEDGRFLVPKILGEQP